MEDQVVILAKVGMGALLGALIGLDREWSRKPAGLRTHILVGAASTLLMALGMQMIEIYATQSLSSVNADPIRIMQAVIVGISFLGAGTIMSRRALGDVKGLTTAASILTTATVGLAVALEQYLLAIGTTILALLTLTVLGWVEGRLQDRGEDREEKPQAVQGVQSPRDWSLPKTDPASASPAVLDRET